MALSQELVNTVPEQDLDLCDTPGGHEPPDCHMLLGEPLQLGGSHRHLVAGMTVQPVQAALTALAEVIGNPGTIVEFLHRLILSCRDRFLWCAPSGHFRRVYCAGR
jgi:hypothetical protein